MNAAPDDRSALSGTPFLLDVTIRDGGYVNGHEWTVGQAQSVVRTVAAAGVPFIEVGYLRQAVGGPLTPSARCEPDYLEALAPVAGSTGLAVMVRPGEVLPEAVKGLAGAGVRMVRVLAARLDVAAAVPFVEAAAEEGLLPVVNLTHASTHSAARLAEAVARAVRAGARIVYLADSNGSLYPHGTAERVRAAVEAAEGAAVGFHPHDNLGLAFANTTAALEAGARAVDASIGGIGKGGGNLRLELIAAHLVRHAGADLRLDPLMHEQVTAPVRIKMLLDAGAGAMMTGMLDVSLEQSRGFREQAAERGYDALLRAGAHPTPSHGGTAGA